MFVNKLSNITMGFAFIDFINTWLYGLYMYTYCVWNKGAANKGDKLVLTPLGPPLLPLLDIEWYGRGTDYYVNSIFT